MTRDTQHPTPDRRERCPYCREAYTRRHGQWRDEAHQCMSELCPPHQDEHQWDDVPCVGCVRAREHQRLRRQLYDGKGRRRTACRQCGNIGGYHRPFGWSCQYNQMLSRGHVIAHRQWQVIRAAGVTTSWVGHGTWYTKARTTAPRWAVLIACATREFPSPTERRELIRWARGHSEGRQTLLRAIVDSRITLCALRSEDVSNAEPWVAQ